MIFFFEIIQGNHSTHLDAFYLWLLAKRAGAHGLVKIILKGSLKQIPVLGWVFAHVGNSFMCC
jgi:1-acyl-sn-glycerol-3-phosphate acyltransferase